MPAVKNYSSWNSATIKTFCCIYSIPKKIAFKRKKFTTNYFWCE